MSHSVTASVPPEPKRKPPRATLEQKIRILDYFHRSDRPQSETVDHFRNEVAISTSTFNEWLKNERDYRDRYRGSEQFEKNARRKVTYKYDKINRAMDLLVQQRLESGEEITEPILRNYWQIYAHRFGVENPKRLVGFSHGWLSQFKKRHGLSRSKQNRGGDLTTTNNEKLLADPTSDEEPAARELSVPVAEIMSRDPDAQGHFQPQRTLSFPQNITYLPSSPRGRSGEQNSQPRTNQGESAESLESAMQLSLNTRKPFSAGDIERFIADIADRFFQDHQYDYPQTVHLYEEFKSSFISERLINLRSSKDATKHMKDTLGSRGLGHVSASSQPAMATSGGAPGISSIGSNIGSSIGSNIGSTIGANIIPNSNLNIGSGTSIASGHLGQTRQTRRMGARALSDQNMPTQGLPQRLSPDLSQELQGISGQGPNTANQQTMMQDVQHPNEGMHSSLQASRIQARKRRDVGQNSISSSVTSSITSSISSISSANAMSMHRLRSSSRVRAQIGNQNGTPSEEPMEALVQQQRHHQPGQQHHNQIHHGNQLHQSHQHRASQSHQSHQSHPHQSHPHQSQSHQNQSHQSNPQQSRHQVQAPHGYRSDEGVATDSRERTVGNLFLREGNHKQRGYSSEEPWPSSESQKLWEQNKLMLS